MSDGNELPEVSNGQRGVKESASTARNRVLKKRWRLTSLTVKDGGEFIVTEKMFLTSVTTKPWGCQWPIFLWYPRKESTLQHEEPGS